MAKWYMGPVIIGERVALHRGRVRRRPRPTTTLNAWSDGTLVHSITRPDWQNGALPATWMNGMFVTV